MSWVFLYPIQSGRIIGRKSLLDNDICSFNVAAYETSYNNIVRIKKCGVEKVSELLLFL